MITLKTKTGVEVEESLVGLFISVVQERCAWVVKLWRNQVRQSKTGDGGICQGVISCDGGVVVFVFFFLVFFFSSRRRHTRCSRDWSSDVCSSDLMVLLSVLT